MDSTASHMHSALHCALCDQYELEHYRALVHVRVEHLLTPAVYRQAEDSLCYVCCTTPKKPTELLVELDTFTHAQREGDAPVLKPVLTVAGTCVVMDKILVI